MQFPRDARTAVSGLSVFAGLFTPVGSAAIAIATALSWFRAPATNFLNAPLPLVLVIVIAIAVGLLGPGSLSVDHRPFWPPRDHPPANTGPVGLARFARADPEAYPTKTLLRQRPVNQLNDHRPLADRRRDSLHTAGPHVAHCKDSRHGGFEKIGRAAQRPIRSFQIFPPKISAGLDELFLVQPDAALQPARLGNCASHRE